MKTIEIISDGRRAQFTTKSVTFDGKEHFYGKMSDVANDAASNCYTFTYDGQTIKFPYEAKDTKTLNAIFSQVQKLQTSRPVPVPSTLTQAPHPAAASSSALSSETRSNDTTVVPTPIPAAPTDSAVEADTPKVLDETKSESDLLPVTPEQSKKPDKDQIKKEKNAEKARLKAEKQAEKARLKAEKARLKAEKQGAKDKKRGEKSHQNPNASAAQTVAANTDSPFKSPNDAAKTPDAAESTSEGENIAHKRAKIKKSLAIFGIILAVIIVISVIYFFIFGTSSDPNIGPNSTESQQYNDIDELINDLE